MTGGTARNTRAHTHTGVLSDLFTGPCRQILQSPDPSLGSLNSAQPHMWAVDRRTARPGPRSTMVLTGPELVTALEKQEVSGSNRCRWQVLVSPPGRAGPEARVGRRLHGPGREVPVGAVLPGHARPEGRRGQAGPETRPLCHHVHRGRRQRRQHD